MGTSGFPYGLRKHVFERWHAGPQMADLHLVLRREREQEARAALVGYEHAHHVLFGGMTLEAGSTHRGQELIGNALHPQLEHASTGALERGNGTGGGNATLIEHDDVVAGVLDVR